MTLITLEQDSRLSDSVLWKAQRDYFIGKGVNAWANGEVPYYVTSNALIAHSYAQIMVHFIMDSLKNKTIDPTKPLYMFELGTGSGKFSYLFVRKFSRLMQDLNLGHIKFCYVLTDFTESNLNFWQGQAGFKPFIEKGMVDFGIYQIGVKQDIHLVHHNITLGTGSCENPILVVGNYIFDTVPHDAFRINAGKLEEGLVTTKTPDDNVVDGKVAVLDRLLTDFTFKPVELPYYNNPHFDNILQKYTKVLPSGTFLVPTGAVYSLENLGRLSNNRLFMISGDKGHASIQSFNSMSAPHIAFHGSFSMMVNFDFIGEYVCNVGGDAIIGEDHEGMKTSLLCLGQKFSDLPETLWANQQFTVHLSTKEFLEIKNFLLRDIFSLNLDEVLSLLKFSYWDCDIFYASSSRLASLISGASPAYIKIIREGLSKLVDNYYCMKNPKNVSFELAHIYQLIHDIDKALEFYQQSLDYFGHESATHFNMGLCYYSKQELTTALQHFKQAVDINPENQGAKDWVEKVEGELQQK